MLYGLQAGFDAQTPHLSVLKMLRDLRFDGVRCDCQGATAAQTARVARDVVAADLIPLLICDQAAQFEYLPPGTDVQWINEPDGYLDPEEYRLTLIDAAQQFPLLHFWGGGIGNLDEDSLDWLRLTRPWSWPGNVDVVVARYPVASLQPHVPHAGFASRIQEVVALKAMIGGRPFGVCEFGYHTASRLLWGWLPWFGISDERVAECVKWEWDFWKDAGAVFAVGYQLNDGPTSTRLNRYGYRRVNGEWKPVASTVPS